MELSDSLEGVRVAAFEQAAAMPFCSFILAELGADVVKVERPGQGDVIRGWDQAVRGLSTGFVWLNANKRDLAVDLTQPEGRVILQRLAATSDVFLENFAPGVAERLGLGYAELSADNPRLIYCSLSGYGHDGPYRDAKAYDILVQGESGILLTSGTPEAPAKVGLPITDLIGGVTAALAVMSALRVRDATGQGQFLDVSMLDAATSWLGYFPQHSWHGGAEPPRTGMHHQYICPQGPFLAADGAYVNIAIGSARDWERFVHNVVRKPEWLADARFADFETRRTHRDFVDGEVQRAIASEPSATWFGLLREAGLPSGEVRSMRSVLEHPQLLHRQMFVNADSPVGELPLVRFPLGRPDRHRQIPGLGEHTDEILAELGYDTDARARLRAEGVLGAD